MIRNSICIFPFRRNHGRNSSPPAKRRTVPSNEHVKKIAQLDEALLDPSLDWYLRIDLGNEKAALESLERERKLKQTLSMIQKARNSILSDGKGIGNGKEYF